MALKLADFLNYFTDTLGRQFATQRSLKFVLYLKCVAAIPFEKLIFKTCTEQSTETANKARISIGV